MKPRNCLITNLLQIAALIAVFNICLIQSASDASEKRDGNLVNFTNDPTQWVGGYINNALEFDGVDDYVHVTDPRLKGLTSMSITAWVKQPIVNEWVGIVTSRESACGDDTAEIGIYGPEYGGPGVSALGYDWPCCGYDAWKFDADFYVPVGHWTFVALTVEPNSASLYMRPVGGLFRKGTDARPHPPLDGFGVYFDIGRSRPTIGYLQGVIDDVRIYDWALDDASMALLAYKIGDPNPWPVYWYKLDETSGFTAADSGYGSEFYGPPLPSEQPVFKAPWRETAKVTQGNNGSTSHYDYGTWDNTYAVDVALTVGSNVLAPADGVVSWYDDDPTGAGGKELVIRHIGPTGKEFYTVYLHLSTIAVKSGSVKQGQLVAKSGDTGDVTGPHLHFHLWRPKGSEPEWSYDSHTMPIERLLLKQVGVDSNFREYDARKGELDNDIIEGQYFESNNAINSIAWNSHSPVDLVITDPDGLIITKQLNEVPGATYLEYDPNEDGNLNDMVYIPSKKIGNYLVEVVPEPNALLTDSYSLEMTTGDGQTMVLAEDVQIQDIPAEPYEFESKLNRSDFDTDGDVDFYDYATFASCWMSADCHYPDWCEGIDLNYDGVVDFNDFVIFAQNWLWEKIPADLDIDGDVDFADYAIFANKWMNDCVSPEWCYGCDFNKSGSVGIDDLAEFASHWLEGL